MKRKSSTGNFISLPEPYPLLIRVSMAKLNVPSFIFAEITYSFKILRKADKGKRRFLSPRVFRLSRRLLPLRGSRSNRMGFLVGLHGGSRIFLPKPQLKGRASQLGPHFHSLIHHEILRATLHLSWRSVRNFYWGYQWMIPRWTFWMFILVRN